MHEGKSNSQHDAPQSLLEQDRMKIHQKANPAPGQLEVGKELCLV
jgi:hypothetical protein